MPSQFDMGSIQNAFLDNMDLPMIMQSDIIQMVAASIVASVGLGTNSLPTVIGSMLISLVGAPIFESAFFTAYTGSSKFPAGVSKGRVIAERNDSFVKLILFIAIPVAVGIVSGIAFSNLRDRGYFKNDICAPGEDNKATDIYPAKEMTSRGLRSTLIPGLVVALICGILMVLGIGNNDINAIVGIGIGTSLLPPLVNGGMMLYEYWSDIRKAKTASKEDLPCYEKRVERRSKEAFNTFYLFGVNGIGLWITSFIVFTYLIKKKR